MEKKPQSKQAEPAKNPDREVYTAPRVTFVELVVEEALMSICKGGAGSGPMFTGCSLTPGGGSCMGGGS